MLFEKFKNILKAKWVIEREKRKDHSSFEEDFTDYTFNEEPPRNDSYSYQEKANSSYQPYSEKELKYYAALEVKPGTSLVEMKAAYKRLVKQYHPDKFHNDEAKRKSAEQVTQKLNESYTYFEQKLKNT